MRERASGPASSASNGATPAGTMPGATSASTRRSAAAMSAGERVVRTTGAPARPPSMNARPRITGRPSVATKSGATTSTSSIGSLAVSAAVCPSDTGRVSQLRVPAYGTATTGDAPRTPGISRTSGRSRSSTRSAAARW